MKKTAQYFYLLVLLFFINEVKSQMVTYSGIVEYTLEITKTASGGGKDGGYNWNVSVDDKNIVKGSFFVTFTGMAGGINGMNMFKLTSIEENIDFSHKVNNEGNDSKSMGKDKPVNSRSRKYGTVWTRLSPDKPVITSGFLMFQNDKYRIMLSGQMPVSIAHESYTEETYPLNEPPHSNSKTTTGKIPLVISGEKTIGNLKYIEGINIQENEQSDDCSKCMDGNLASLVHGDLECSYISKITTSWTLVKRNKECDANLTYLRGDVKINGVPVQKGNIKVGPGDVITTGPKSRVQFSLKNVNETYMLGSKSKLRLSLDPCRANDIKPMSKGTATLHFVTGKVLGIGKKHSFNPHARTGGGGVRGQLKFLKPSNSFYASVNPDLASYFNLPIDPEKEEMLNMCKNLSDDFSAFYVDFQDGEVKDITAVKGAIKLEDGEFIKSKIINEGTTVNKWNDGTIMSDVIISTAE